MAFIDLFKPKWKHSNSDVRIAAVEKVSDLKKLAYIAKNAKYDDVQSEALNKIFESENGNDLIFLHEIGFVRAKGAGQSIVEINASIENLLNKRIDVLIKPGTYFVSKGNYQNMVTRDEYSFELNAKGKRSICINATCINAGLPIPNENNFFYGVKRVSDDLVRFLKQSKKDTINSMATQAGTWAITDNMSKYEIKSRLYNTNRYTGEKTPAISDEDIEAAMIVLWKLGIHTQLWREKTSDGKNAEYFEKQRKTEAIAKKKGIEAEALSKEERQLQLNWVSIPAGNFKMGSPISEVGRSDNETQHEVTLSAFKMTKYAVTFEQYDLFCIATSREKPDDEGWGRGNRPVMNVSWFDANAFAEWLGCRLPTEAEWEYVCRAGTTTMFNTGKNITTAQANYDLDKTLPVGSFPPNAWGLYDMHGNVFEWCSDWYGDYSTSAQKNPTGPTSGSNRVSRGGSWGTDTWDCRSANRNGNFPVERFNDLGFRLVSPK